MTKRPSPAAGTGHSPYDAASAPIDNTSPLGFFNSMPSWLKALVMVMVAPFLAIALAGVFLQVNVNEYLDRFADIQFRKIEASIAVSLAGQTDQLTVLLEPITLELERQALDARDLRELVVDSTRGITELQDWACGHADVQGLVDDYPKFCNE